MTDQTSGAIDEDEDELESDQDEDLEESDAAEAIEAFREEFIGEILACAIAVHKLKKDALRDFHEKLQRLSVENLELVLLDYRDRADKHRKRPEQDNRPIYCYSCGSAWTPGYISCTSCGSIDQGRSEARPTVTVANDTETFMGPWRLLPWPRSGSVGVYGGPGSGKSSLAAMIRPLVWITKEQVPKPVGEMFRRLWSDGYMPQVHTVESADDVEAVLKMHYRGPIVLDSATALKLKDGLRATELMVEWSQLRDERALVIIQVNKGGDSAGYMEIPHKVDAVVNISPDPWGVRAFRVTKSRWSPLGATYWSFSEKGQVEVPDFPASYSVEGSPGGYWLHPFPIKGAKWHGLLAAMAGQDQLRPRSASAAVRATYMPSGFVEPMDVWERRRFAEAHGLRWVEPNEFQPGDG